MHVTTVTHKIFIGSYMFCIIKASHKLAIKCTKRILVRQEVGQWVRVY